MGRPPVNDIVDRLACWPTESGLFFSFRCLFCVFCFFFGGGGTTCCQKPMWGDSGGGGVGGGDQWSVSID